MAPFPSPHEMTWHDSDAPDPDIAGLKIVVWSRGYQGAAVVVNGMWFDDRSVPRWGAGKPGGSETYWCLHPDTWMR